VSKKVVHQASRWDRNVYVVIIIITVGLLTNRHRNFRQLPSVAPNVCKLCWYDCVSETNR